jgi:SAM-dependent methyltransferase
MLVASASNDPRIKKERVANRRSRAELLPNWHGSAQHRESTLHQLSPYIGKLKSTMASALITAFTDEGDLIYDPFCGSGSIALEAWAANRRVIATDLSPYAVTLTRAKLSPYLSFEEANAELEMSAVRVNEVIQSIDLRKVPQWVRAFYHPETLREVIAWAQILKKRRSYFLLSCLLGIAHHQRPGFLSYPSSHAVPYLRDRSFPRDAYPDLYEYRPLYERLQRKLRRSMKRLPTLDYSIERSCSLRSAATFAPRARVNAIITSPPYMRRLDYGRDNRLRLWFLGSADWEALDRVISPREVQFLDLFRRCLRQWWKVLNPRGVCILVVGDSYCRSYDMDLPEAIAKIAKDEVGRYSLEWKCTSRIPDMRRVRRGYNGNKCETVMIFRRNP